MFNVSECLLRAGPGLGMRLEQGLHVLVRWEVRIEGKRGREREREEKGNKGKREIEREGFNALKRGVAGLGSRCLPCACFSVCVVGYDWCAFVFSFQKSCDGVTVSEISGQELSLTTSQTDNISWLFEVSVNVSVTVCMCVCVWGGGGGMGGIWVAGRVTRP